MKIYSIESDHSEVPLLEFRTDGKNIEVMVDNTNGKLPASIGNDFQRLKQIVASSSHLKITEPTEPVVGLLRYLLENGDIVEITTDGRSALLNGTLLDESEKQALFDLISSGHLAVKEKADLTRPMPIMPTRRQAPKPVKKKTISKEMLDAIAKIQQENKTKSSLDNSSYDSKIESMDFSDQPYPAMAKDLLYMLKYECHRGGTKD